MSIVSMKSGGGFALRAGGVEIANEILMHPYGSALPTLYNETQALLA